MKNKYGKLNLKSKLLLLLFAFIIILACSPFVWYKIATLPVSTIENKQQISVTIPLGSSSDEVLKILEENGVIRSKLASKIYIKLNEVSGFQAGDYTFVTDMTLQDIFQSLKTGIVYENKGFSVTFLEGKTMKFYAKKIAEVTNNSEEDVYNLLKDEEYLDELITKYWFLTEEIKNKDIYYSLEGYLFPETYTFESEELTVKQIFDILLGQTDKVLSEYKDDIENSNYSVHQLLTMASVSELEAVTADDRKTVAGVFYNRLNSNSSLGSDVTTYYAIGVELGERDLWQYELDKYNPYNTRGPNMEGKLPVGPIASVGRESIVAAIYPNETDYYYFVADKNGKLYFSKTYSEHSTITQQLIDGGMWIEFEQ